MRFLLRALTGLILFTVTIGLISYGGYRVFVAKQTADERPKRPVRERTFVVNTGVLEPVQVTPVITAYGEVRSWRSLLLRTPVAGEVVEIAEGFRSGSAVKQGERLFVIDPEALQSRTEDAEAGLAEALAEKAEADQALVFSNRELASARKQLDLRSTELQRQRQLLSRGLATESNVSAAELAHASAEQTAVSRGQSQAAASKRVERASLRIQRAQIAVDEARRGLSETGVYAAFDGVLSNVSLQLGQRLSVNEQVGTLIDPAALEVVFRVPNSKFSRLIDERGALRKQAVEVELELGDKNLTVAGRIERVDAMVQAGQSGRLIYASLGEIEGNTLLPGDFVTVRVSEPKLEGVSRVPAGAVSDEGLILVVDQEQRLREVGVDVLRREDQQLIIRPKRFGGRFVTERMPQLAGGVKVEVAGAELQTAEPELIELDKARRDKLIAFIENNTFIPEDRRQSILERLRQPKVPRQVVERIESRM